jgi:hypothetical protein
MDVFEEEEEEEKIFDFKDAKMLEPSHPLPYDDRLSEYPSMSVIHHAVQDFFEPQVSKFIHHHHTSYPFNHVPLLLIHVAIGISIVLVVILPQIIQQVST